MIITLVVENHWLSKTHLDTAFVKTVGNFVCKTFIYLYVCMHADAHNYTHKSMYTWVVIADANWRSGLLSSGGPSTVSWGTILQKFLLALANVKSA